MAIGVLVIGRSGSGKSASLRNFTKDEFSLINVNGKPLPFKNDFNRVINTDNAGLIQKALKKTTSKVVVIDDSQYIMANEFMRNALSGREKGGKIFDTYNSIARNFWDILDCVKAMPDDTIVYFLHHEDIDDYGNVKAKTQGKAIDNHIILEGCFTIVLRTMTNDGGYYFSTRTNGNDTVKTPMGMFKDTLIDNDLKAVDTAIRNYYGLAPVENKKA